VDWFEEFKQSILDDAVFSDYQGLWEPLWALRGDLAQEGQSEADRQHFAERALRELHAAGLIYFFRVLPWASGDVNAAAEDDALRLTAAQVDDTLRGSWWRGEERLDPDAFEGIWWGPTPTGEAAANEAT
jgi:hypothetical protein